MTKEIFTEIIQLQEEIIKKLEQQKNGSELSRENYERLYLRTKKISTLTKQLTSVNRYNALHNKRLSKISSDAMNELLTVKEYQIGSSTVNTQNKTLTVRDKTIKLTRIELQLLTFLAANKNNFITRIEIMTTVWNENNYQNGRSMDVYMCKIRKYLKDDTSFTLINIHSKGYRIVNY